ncbi:MAG TPA: carbohydrate ABC transporter permease [Chloroflexota bacterium]|jgi:multiple sugar transport system permease protein|nr:carbohydrate ABC transporter permease [Chloroflexota bacterium]
MRWLKVAAYLALTLWAVLTLLPLYWMVVTAFKTQVAVQAIPPDWWPSPPTTANFAVFFARAPALRWLFNSAFVATAVMLATLLFASMAGYAFAKLSFPGNRLLFWLTMSILVVPLEVKLVPLFELMVRWGMVDTYLGLILPAVAAPFSIFLMKQFMTTLPSEVFDAARIDGASELAVFWRVVLPLSVPGLTVLAIFSFIGNWNAFIWPVIVTRAIEMRTLPPALAVLQLQAYTDYGLQMAGSTFAAIPTILLFLALQRYFLRGITIGALKG